MGIHVKEIFFVEDFSKSLKELKTQMNND